MKMPELTPKGSIIEMRQAPSEPQLVEFEKAESTKELTIELIKEVSMKSIKLSETESAKFLALNRDKSLSVMESPVDGHEEKAEPTIE